jgi:transcriptional regulator with PAS, ATPase and Fis domain
MVGRDPAMLQLFDTIRQVGRIDVPVLIEGESGTGKEMVAMALHKESSRRDSRIVPVNCASLSPGLLESELFGHVKGAFTGASRDKKGRFELADGGSIFLDEIGELSPDIQVKLLRVLQDGSFEPVGSEKTQKVSTRLLCATNRKLDREVETGRFRADLYYRLCVVLITIPPLRQRKSDISLLTEYLLRRAAEDFAVPVPALSPQFVTALEIHSWPGNVRELDNALRHALIRAPGDLLRPSHLPTSTVGSGRAPEAHMSRRRNVNAKAISAALSACNGNKVQTAKRLGISRATLYRYLADLDFLTT